MEHPQKTGVNVVDSKISNKSFVFLIHILNIIIVCFLIYSGVEIGDKLATFFYYDVLKLVDPYQGATSFRVLITYIFAGVVSSSLGVTYAELVTAESKYVSYAIAYTSVIVIMVMGHFVVYEEFPLGVQFWGFKVGVLVLTSAIIFIMFHFLTRKHNRGQT